MELNNKGWELCMSNEYLMLRKGFNNLGVDVAMEYILLLSSTEVIRKSPSKYLSITLT